MATRQMTKKLTFASLTLTTFASLAAIVNADCQLSADEDWSGSGTTLVAPGVTVDLNGYSLATGGFAEYIPLDYVETDGSQWVHTEYTPAGTDAFELKFSTKYQWFQYLLNSAVRGQSVAFGVAVNDNRKAIEFMRRARRINPTDDGVGKYGIGVTEADQAAGLGILDEDGVVSGRDYTVVLDSGKGFWAVNGVTNDFSGTASGQRPLTPQAPFTLFCSNGAAMEELSPSTSTNLTYFAQCRFYHLKIWDNDGNLKCNIIPAYGVNEAAVGLYDTVRRKFLRPYKKPTLNKTTGEWTGRGEHTTFAKSYQILPFVETDGTQYVDTGFVPACSNRTEICVRMKKNDMEQTLFSSQRHNPTRYALMAHETGKLGFDYVGVVTNFNYDVETDYKISIAPIEAMVNGSTYLYNRGYVNDDEVVKRLQGGAGFVSMNSATNTYRPTFSFYLFATHINNTSPDRFAHCRFYSFKVYGNSDKETLLCDIVPAIGANENAIGLYDKVRNKFMQSATNHPLQLPYEVTIKNSAQDQALLEIAVPEGAAVTNNFLEIAPGGIDLVKSGGGEWVYAGGLAVADTFVPLAGTVDGVTMQSGSTLDLSRRTTPLDLEESGLTFASGATVYVKVGDVDRLSSTRPLISWNAVPPVMFARSESERNFCLVAKPDGLYAAVGLMLIIR